jgi:hypothetical protein
MCRFVIARNKLNEHVLLRTHHISDHMTTAAVEKRKCLAPTGINPFSSVVHLLA